jgi:uncharacterized membrane protein
MHGPIDVKFPNNISKWQMGFNSAFKGLIGWILLGQTTYLQKGVCWFITQVNNILLSTDTEHID